MHAATEFAGYARHVPLPDVLVRHRHIVLGAIDSLAWLIGLTAGTLLTRAGLATAASPSARLIWLLGFAVTLQLGVGTVLGLYRGRYRIGSQDEQRTLLLTALACFAILTGGIGVLTPTSPAVLIAGAPMAAVLMVGGRQGWWFTSEQFRRRLGGRRRRRVLVFGAGEAGAEMVRAMLTDPDSDYLPVGLLDDDPYKARRILHGVRVVGTRAQLATAAAELDAEVLLIAIRGPEPTLISDLTSRGLAAGLALRVLPSTTDIIGSLSLGDIRELTPAQLLGRAEVNVDLAAICATITGRRVLVTGAGGSIGSELARQVARLDPEVLVLLDRDETALHSLQLSMEGRALLDSQTLVVADIRDRRRLHEVFARWQPEVVFHAAALKHLSLLEMHPGEGIKTNTLGTRNVLEAAARVGVGQFVNISTDKAADPTSVLGATKLLAERETARFAARTGQRYVSVRFGNVLDSRGSVLPTFRAQIANGGPLTVTHPDVTRYFMTIPEAVRLVLQAGSIGRGGEVLILDMGEPVRIADLATRLIEHAGADIDIVYTGLRPGEKLHEALVARTEHGTIREHPRITHTQSETPVHELDPGLLLGATTAADVLALVSTSAYQGELSSPVSVAGVLRLLTDPGASPTSP